MQVQQSTAEQAFLTMLANAGTKILYPVLASSYTENFQNGAVDACVVHLDSQQMLKILDKYFEFFFGGNE